MNKAMSQHGSVHSRYKSQDNLPAIDRSDRNILGANKKKKKNKSPIKKIPRDINSSLPKPKAG